MVKSENQSDFWDELPDNVKADIDDAITRADAGELFSHEEVMEQYKKWLEE